MKWINVKQKVPPAMETVILCVDGEVIVGWNETLDREEDVSYCTWETWPESQLTGDGVTHWMPLPKPPKS